MLGSHLFNSGRSTLVWADRHLTTFNYIRCQHRWYTAQPRTWTHIQCMPVICSFNAITVVMRCVLYPINEVTLSWFLLLCRIHFPWLFLIFSGQNKSFSFVFVNWYVHAKYQCQFSIACNHTRNKSSGTNLTVEVQIIGKRMEQKKFELMYAVCGQQFKTFFCIFINFCTMRLFNSLTSSDRRNHVYAKHCS